MANTRDLMISFPHCKINLGLNILSRRPDGYHDIETCFYPVPICDILEIIPSGQVSFNGSGIPIPGAPEQNLCLKAYHLLQAQFDLPPVNIHLHKIVPMGAGLGGGSSDAAFTLKSINEVFQLGLSLSQLASYASQLGSDCSYFLNNKPMIGTGRGEVLRDIQLDLKGFFLVLIKPPIHVSTADAYSNVVHKQPLQTLSTILKKPVSEWKDLLINDFEASVFVRYPAIGEVKKQIYEMGAVYASMSGSGSSVFGLFKQGQNAREKFEGSDYWEVAL